MGPLRELHDLCRKEGMLRLPSEPYEILPDGDIQRALKLLLWVHGGLIARGRASLTNPVVLESTAEKVYAKFWEVVKEASKEPGLEYLPICDMDHA